MRKTTRLRQLIEDPRLLVMPGAFDPLSARVVEQAGFDAVQCTGLGISASHLGLPDVSLLAMSDMVSRTMRIAAAVDIPVMADGDTGFGNAVNVHFAVREFERAGAAGVNLEDQVLPKRCGHLEGKEVIPTAEAALKIAAARDAATDPDFVINARTDALAVSGLDDTIVRANAYLAAGANMVFIDGAHSLDVITRAVKAIQGPVAVNMVEGGKTPRDLGFEDLERAGVARVSLPLTTIYAAVAGMRRALEAVRANRGCRGYDHLLADFDELHALIGMDTVYDLECRFVAPERLTSKYGMQGGS